MRVHSDDGATLLASADFSDERAVAYDPARVPIFQFADLPFIYPTDLDYVLVEAPLDAGKTSAAAVDADLTVTADFVAGYSGVNASVPGIDAAQPAGLGSFRLASKYVLHPPRLCK
jgi:hypothetical protein